MTEEFSSSDGNPAYIGHEEGTSVVIRALDDRDEDETAAVVTNQSVVQDSMQILTTEFV